MTRQVEQRGAHRARRPDDEDCLARRKAAIAREHLIGREVSERDADRLRQIDAIRNGHEKTRGPEGILRISADDAEIGNHLAFSRRTHSGAGLIDDTDQIIARREG